MDSIPQNTTEPPVTPLPVPNGIFIGTAWRVIGALHEIGGIWEILSPKEQHLFLTAINQVVESATQIYDLKIEQVDARTDALLTELAGYQEATL